MFSANNKNVSSPNRIFKSINSSESCRLCRSGYKNIHDLSNLICAFVLAFSMVFSFQVASPLVWCFQHLIVCFSIVIIEIGSQVAESTASSFVPLLERPASLRRSFCFVLNIPAVCSSQSQSHSLVLREGKGKAKPAAKG